MTILMKVNTVHIYSTIIEPGLFFGTAGLVFPVLSPHNKPSFIDHNRPVATAINGRAESAISQIAIGCNGRASCNRESVQ